MTTDVSSVQAIIHKEALVLGMRFFPFLLQRCFLVFLVSATATMASLSSQGKIFLANKKAFPSWKGPRLSKNLLGGSEGRSPPSCIPNPATCAVDSEALRSKVSLHVSPAAPKAQGKCVLAEKAATGGLFRQPEAFPSWKGPGISQKSVCVSLFGFAFPAPLATAGKTRKLTCHSRQRTRRTCRGL